MTMKDDFIDEARKCPQCGIVTYCERCPICGTKLPRTAKKILRFRNKTAGEDEDVLQQTNRITGTSQTKAQKPSHPYEEDQDTNPKESFEAGNGRTRSSLHKNAYLREKRRNKNILILVVFFMLLAVMIVAITIASRVDITPTSIEINTGIEQQESQYPLYERNAMNGNDGRIQVDEYYYDAEAQAGYVNITNYGERICKGNFVLYHQDEKIGYFDNLFILPYENFELTIYTDIPAEEYEIQQYEFYDIASPAPNFDFYTYNDYGVVEVEALENIDDEQLTMLLHYLSEALSYGDEELSEVCVYLPNSYIYEAYVDSDGNIFVYYEDSDYEIIRTFEVQLQTSKGISL